MTNIKKTEIFSTFARLKREIRKLLKERTMLYDLKKMLRRKKSILEHNGTIFDNHRINEFDISIKNLHTAIVKINTLIAKTGYHINNISDLSEQMLTMHDKSQILGVSLTHLYNVVGKDKTGNIPLRNLIFVHNVEYRGKEDSAFGDSTLNPFFNTAYVTMMEELKKPKLKEMTNNMFAEIFPHLPIHKISQNTDGTTEFHRAPPTLKLINCNQE